MIGKAEVDVPATHTHTIPGHCSTARHHIRGFAGQRSRCFRLSLLLPSSLMPEVMTLGIRH